MKSISQQDALRFSALVIVVIWLWLILNMIFEPEPWGGSSLTNLNLTQNFPLTALYTLGKGIAYMLLALWLLWLTGERVADLGFHRDQLPRHLGLGALFGFAIFVFSTALLNPLIKAIFPSLHVSNAALFSSNLNIVILFFLGIVKGGFLEEFWRIFVLTRFEKLFGTSGLVAALVLSSAIFGLGHAYQGSSAIIGTGIIGFLNGLVYLRKRSAFEAVMAHAMFDMLAVIGGAIYNG